MTAIVRCGSFAAYWRHRRKGEEPCQACKTAATAYIKLRAAERQRAWRRLASEYPERFRELLTEEREPSPDYGRHRP